ncbi:hypothetical protein C8F01DRAFT_1135962 [Mycena amicta]|nr:hypothetical protein C8F01DRAFT_1135962 [Mycena amicta]
MQLFQLASQALIIAAPPSGLTTGNNTISCTVEPSDAAGLLTFFIARNSTKVVIAQDVSAEPHPDAVPVLVTIPSGISGNGWQILAERPDSSIVAQSLPFQVRDTPDGERGGGAVIGGVIAGVVGLALLVLLFFIFLRRRQRHASHGPTFDLESAFTQAALERDHSRSLSESATEPEARSNWTEVDKMEWERELEDQFARARAGTPSLPRGATPSPLPPSMMTIAPQVNVRN